MALRGYSNHIICNYIVQSYKGIGDLTIAKIIDRARGPERLYKGKPMELDREGIYKVARALGPCGADRWP